MDDEEKIPSPAEYSWGGNLLKSGIDEPVYPEVVSERIPAVSLDIGNSVAAYLLDIIAERVDSYSDNILSTDFSSILLENNLLFNYYLINTLSLSHFESTMFLVISEHLCYKNSEVGSEILKYFDDERERYTIVKEEGELDKRIAIIDLLADNYTAGMYLNLIEDELNIDSSLDIDEQLLDIVRDIRDDRGSLVHNFTYLFQSEAKHSVRKQTAQCQLLVKKSSELLHQELTLHQVLMESFNS